MHNNENLTLAQKRKLTMPVYELLADLLDDYREFAEASFLLGAFSCGAIETDETGALHLPPLIAARFEGVADDYIQYLLDAIAAALAVEEED